MILSLFSFTRGVRTGAVWCEHLWKDHFRWVSIVFKASPRLFERVKEPSPGNQMRNVKIWRTGRESSILAFGICFQSFVRLVRSHASPSLILNQFISSNEDSVLWTACEVLNSLDGSIVFPRRSVELHTNPYSGLKRRLWILLRRVH